MPRLEIDNREVAVPPGCTILDAARKLGIDIPTLCFLDGRAPSTSCTVCVVKVRNPDRLVPSCGTRAEEGMRVESETEDVREARKAALELLLGDHLGDCIAPCQNVCPAHMNIPLMIRQIAAGKYRDAIATVKEHIALPAVLGRICPAPCEKGCRRSGYDGAVSICLLKRFAAEADLSSESPYLPLRKPASGKRVAIVGAGPAGLAGAYHLLQEGHACTVFDDHEKPGGMLRYGVDEGRLPREVLDAEIGLIEELGAEFRMGTKIGNARSLDEIRRDYDAVLVAVGDLAEGGADRLGLRSSARSIQVDRRTHRTSIEGVFAAGNAMGKGRLAVRSLAQGKAAAFSIHQYLSGREPTGPERPFTTRMGKLTEAETEHLVASASPAPRATPPRGGGGFSEKEAWEEARRCLRCDCRKSDSCRLRRYARIYGAEARRYEGERRRFERCVQHPGVVYEPGKCIACGLCVRIAQSAREPLGLTFVGRGFDVRVRVPFSDSIAEGMRKAAAECVAACPTGALAFK